MQAASKLAEKVLGHDSASTEAGLSNPAQDMGKNEVQVIDTYKSKLVDPTDVILKVTGTTICGSDLHLYHGVQLSKGDILGHEFCGIADSVGSSVTNLKPGQRVVASSQIACGTCRFCEQKLSSMCESTNPSSLHNAMYGSRTLGTLGYSHFTRGFAGGQAEFVRMPFGGVNLLVVPGWDGIELFLSDVLPTSYHALQDTRVYEKDTVAIWGRGPIGIMVAVFAFMDGVEAGNYRLLYSSLPRGTTVTAKIHELVPGGVGASIEWGAHYFEMALGLETDASEILNEMVTSTRKFGRCGIKGIYAGLTNHFNVGSLMERGIRFIGNGQAPVHMYWQKLLKMVENEEFDPRIILSHRLQIEDMAKLYKKFDAKENGIVKPFVQTRFPAPRKAGPELGRLD
ncbi:GroES-like protein [Choiromyces venosus 120613-1]|uniref:GroES-like protein n=1 Tax=Choiromyces venosus 120613-1 TaxID=1336337 RepID=A0A3N4JZY2_9PEZI|nr:GroES-like protein [Choiromyces venosus 120613-1]